MSGEFGTGKTIFVLAIVVGCFAVLWPKVFYPMLTASTTATAPSKTSLPKTESTGPRAERPAHLHPDMMHPALRERGRALPVRTIDKEAKPGPMPGVRPPMGGGAGHIAPSTNTKASSSMSIIMPLYTVGIIIFFIYTIMKVLFKKCPDDDDKTPKIKNFHMDPEYRKYVFEEEYLDSGDCAKDTFVKRTEQRETVGLRRRHIHDQPDRKIEDEQMDQLRRRLEDTERAMERLMAQMGTVSDKLTAAKITEVLSQAQTQAKLLKIGLDSVLANENGDDSATHEQLQEDFTSEDEDLLSSEDLTATFTDDESLLSTALRHKLLEQILVERHPSIQYQLDDAVIKGIHRGIEPQNKHECFPQTTALPTTPTTRRCEVKESSEKYEKLERENSFSPAINDKLTFEGNKANADVKSGELSNLPEPTAEKQILNNDQSLLRKDKNTLCEISQNDEERQQVENIAAQQGENLIYSPTRTKTEATAGSVLGQVMMKHITGIRVNLSPSPPSSMPAQKVSFHPKDSVIETEHDGSDDDRSSDATETGADVSELRSFAEDVDASKLANEVVSITMLSRGNREFTPEAVMPKLNDVSQERMTRKIEIDQKSGILDIKMPTLGLTPEAVMPKFDDTPKVVMPKFDDTPEVVMPKFDDTPEVVMPKFDDTPEVVMPKFDDTPEVEMHKFDDTPEVEMHKFDDTPEVEMHKFDETPEIVMPKFDDTAEAVVPESEIQKIEKASTRLDELHENDFPEFVLQQVDNIPKLGISKVDVGVELSQSKASSDSKFAVSKVDETTALEMLNLDDARALATPDLDDDSVLAISKVDDAGINETPTTNVPEFSVPNDPLEVTTPHRALQVIQTASVPETEFIQETARLNVDNNADSMTTDIDVTNVPKEKVNSPSADVIQMRGNDHVTAIPEVDDAPQIERAQANVQEAVIKVPDVPFRLVTNEDKNEILELQNAPKILIPETDDTSDAEQTNIDVPDTLAPNANDGRGENTHAFEAVMLKDDEPEFVEPKAAEPSVSPNDISQTASTTVIRKNNDADEVLTHIAANTAEYTKTFSGISDKELPHVKCYSDETDENFDINPNLTRTSHVTHEAIKFTNNLEQKPLVKDLEIEKTPLDKEGKATDNSFSEPCRLRALENTQSENHEVRNIPNENEILEINDCSSTQAKPTSHSQIPFEGNLASTDQGVFCQRRNEGTSMTFENVGTAKELQTTEFLEMLEPTEIFTPIPETGVSVVKVNAMGHPTGESDYMQESDKFENPEYTGNMAPHKIHDPVGEESPTMAKCASAFLTTEDTDESESSSYIRQMNSRNNLPPQLLAENQQLHETTYLSTIDVPTKLEDHEHAVKPVQDYVPKGTVIKMALQPLTSEEDVTDSEDSEEKFAAVGTQTSMALDPPRMLRKKTVETSTQVEEGALSVIGFNTSWCVDDACEAPDALLIRDVTLDALLPSETQALVFQNKIGRAVSPNIEEDVSEIENSPYVITSQLSLNIIGLEHTNDAQDSKPTILLQAANPTHSTAHNGGDWKLSPRNYSSAAMDLPVTTSFSQTQFANINEQRNKVTNSQPTREIFIQSVAAKENADYVRNIIRNELNPQEISRPKTPTSIGNEKLLNEHDFEALSYIEATSADEVMPGMERTKFQEPTTPMAWLSDAPPCKHSEFLPSPPLEDTEIPMYFTCSVVHTPCSSVPQTPDQEAEIILASKSDRVTYVVNDAASPMPDAFDSSFVLGATTSMLQNQATTASSKGSSPDIQEYEVVQKASGNQQTTRQQLPQTEEKQLHSIDDHFHPKEENIRETSTVDAIESADEGDESELRFSPKTGPEYAPSESADAGNEKGNRMENITSS